MICEKIAQYAFRSFPYHLSHSSDLLWLAIQKCSVDLQASCLYGSVYPCVHVSCYFLFVSFRNPATGSILSASLSCRNFAISLGDSDLAELLTMAEADEVASTVVSSGVSQNNIFIGMGTALDHLYSQETSY